MPELAFTFMQFQVTYEENGNIIEVLFSVICVHTPKHLEVLSLFVGYHSSDKYNPCWVHSSICELSNTYRWKQQN